MSDLPPSDPDPTVVTTCGICLCCVVGAVGRAELVGAIGRAELTGVPLEDCDLDMLNF